MINGNNVVVHARAGTFGAHRRIGTREETTAASSGNGTAVNGTRGGGTDCCRAGGGRSRVHTKRAVVVREYWTDVICRRTRSSPERCGVVSRGIFTALYSARERRANETGGRLAAGITPTTTSRET